MSQNNVMIKLVLCPIKFIFVNSVTKYSSEKQMLIPLKPDKNTFKDIVSIKCTVFCNYFWN